LIVLAFASPQYFVLLTVLCVLRHFR